MPQSEICLLSVYSELLRMALTQDDPFEGTVGELVSRALARRPAPAGGGRSADRIADWLSYDVALVQLCERVDVDHGMLAPEAGPASRARAESLVAARIPFFSEALGIG